MEIGCKLASEAVGPEELARPTVLAEAAGFDFVEMGDPFHPWLDVPGDRRDEPLREALHDAHRRDR